jgi:hypothetical protein
MPSNGTPIRKAVARPATGAELGIAWWNSMTERQRWEALDVADTDCPAEAWAHWRSTAGKCEELAHG